MKLIMTAVLLLGLATIGMAGIGKARTMARSASIVSGIADLRQENNLTECQQVESHVSCSLRCIQDSFAPIIWVGGLIALCGLTGIIVASRKQPRQTANNGVHDSLASSAS